MLISFNFLGIIELAPATLLRTLSPDEEKASLFIESFFSAFLSNKDLIAGTKVMTSSKANKIPNETVIPKSLNSGSGDTTFERKPTIVAKVASVKAIPTELKVFFVESFTDKPSPSSSRYLPVK